MAAGVGMNAIPEIPASVASLEQLDRWIEANAAQPQTLAERLRFAVAVMDRAVEIGERQRA